MLGGIPKLLLDVDLCQKLERSHLDIKLHCEDREEKKVFGGS